MTITRLWQAGAELGNNKEFDTLETNLGVSSSTKKTGGYGYYGGWVNVYSAQSLAATKQLRFGYFVYVHASANYNNVQFIATSTEMLAIQFNAGLINLRVEGVSKDNHPFSAYTWFHLGLDAKVAETGGWAKLYLDGVEICSFEGDTGNLDINKIRMGQVGGTGGRNTHFDDVYVDDTAGESAPTAPPLKRFYPVMPNAVGNYSQWTPTSGSTNYEMVDEVPPNDDTDYVETNIVDKKDSYGLETITLETGQEVSAVIPFAYIKREGSTEEIALGTRLSSTDLLGSDQAPGSAYGVLWERQITKPGGGSWGQSDIDAMEVLIKSSGSF